jgi:two-component system, OmpR family, sensor histidine kinase VicK
LTNYLLNNHSNSERTEVLYGTENAKKLILQITSRAKSRINICDDYAIPSVTIPVQLFKKVFFRNKKRRSNNSHPLAFRYITEITQDNILRCKELMKIANIRHLNGIKANFAVSDTEYTSAAIAQQVHAIPEVIYSNVKRIVEQHQYLFETLWNKAIPAEQRIREIEEGIQLPKMYVIQIPQSIQKFFIDMVKSTKYEILLILPTVNAFLREQRIGIIQLLKQAATERGVNVRILTPTDNTIENIILKNIITVAKEQEEEKKKKNFDLRTTNIPFEEIAVNTVTIVVADKKESLVIEKTDDSKENFVEAVGLATYSNSKPTVMSYISIFESLWKQVELYEQLKLHDKMQKEFINIASHELKTPIQAIIGYADLTQRHPEKRDEMMQAIQRNALRLQSLTNDILDVTRIESERLNLNKEQFNLDYLITSIVGDYRSQIEKDKNNVSLLYNTSYTHDSLTVEADKDRIGQVVSNLLSNAIKFTSSKKEEGEGQCVVSVTAEVKDDNNDNDQKEVIVTIKDTGQGIHPEILPRLFTKFATRSFTGTGLGLYISKSIVEAHGGKMWAENNRDERGATFSFTLPLSDKGESKIKQEDEQEEQQISTSSITTTS